MVVVMSHSDDDDGDDDNDNDNDNDGDDNGGDDGGYETAKHNSFRLVPPPSTLDLFLTSCIVRITFQNSRTGTPTT